VGGVVGGWCFHHSVGVCGGVGLGCGCGGVVWWFFGVFVRGGVAVVWGVGWGFVLMCGKHGGF